MTTRGFVWLSVVAVLAGCADGEGGDATGEDLVAELGCHACHSDEDTDLAPSLHGLWGSEVMLEDGTTVTVDESYVRRSITEPGAEVVSGYQPLMPQFSLSDSEVEALVEYVRSLG